MVEWMLGLSSQSLDAMTEDDQTPLYFAILNNHQLMIRTLRKVGASVEITLEDKLLASSDELMMLEVMETNPDLYFPTPTQLELLKEPIPEEEILETRYRIYFELSLVSRLLFFL